MTRALLAAGAALALLAAAPAPALAADDVAEARALFEQGATLYRAAKYREAIAKFEAAYRMKPHGAIRFNVAQCREKLGEWPAALRSYQDYLRELPDARDRAAVRATIVRIEQRLASAGVMSLLIYTDPPGASVRLDGKARGRTPYQITLPPGVYRVALALDGYLPEDQEVEVNLAASRLLDVVLQPKGSGVTKGVGAAVGATAAVAAAGAPPVSTAKAGPTGRAEAEPASSMTSGVPVAAPQPPAGAAPPDLRPAPIAATTSPAPAPPPAGTEPPKKRVYTWVAAGTALVAGAAGAWFGLQAQKQQDTLRDGTVRSAADAEALAKSAQSKAHTANVLYGISGVAAATGVTLFFVEGRF